VLLDLAGCCDERLLQFAEVAKDMSTASRVYGPRSAAVNRLSSVDIHATSTAGRALLSGLRSRVMSSVPERWFVDCRMQSVGAF
jgi:hypothetical protein